MPTDQHRIRIRGIPIDIVRKDIKNLHVGVYPPDGRVRVAAPTRIDDEGVRLAVISRLAWIRKQREAFRRQARQSQRDMVTGESHYVLGRRYRLAVIEYDGPACVTLKGTTTLELRVRPGANREKRERVVNDWYRQLLRDRIPGMLEEWESILGVKAMHWGIKRMKTKWGSCNPDANRIWLNLELAKKPPQCLEYVVVHELVHLRERHHGTRFVELMDAFMPPWRLHRDELNRGPLSHETWSY